MDKDERKVLHEIRNLLADIRVDNAEAKKDIEFIKEQTTRTNGRLLTAETKIQVLETTQSTILVKVAAGVFLVAAVISAAIASVIK